MSDPSSQPTQPLTDEELARTMLARRRGAVQSLNGCDCMQPDSHGIVLDSLGDIPRLLAEVSRLRAENTGLQEGLERARKEHGRTCYETVYWWDGEYEGECELVSFHGGPHFDGLSWWDDDRNEVDAPALGLDQDGRGQ